MEQKPLEARLQLTESERERLYAAARASRMSTNRYLTHITRRALAPRPAAQGVAGLRGVGRQ